MSDNEELITYIKRAFELKQQDCCKQAIEMLYKALAIEPDNIEILIQIGELYFQLHNYTRAVQYTEKVLAQDENNLQSLKLLKNIYIKRDELMSAKEIAEKIYEIDSMEENLISLIKLAGQLGLFEEFDKYNNEINKSSACLFACAQAYYEASNLVCAEKFVKKAYELDRENADYKILIGRILFDKNEFDKSRCIFDQFPKTTENSDVLNYRGLFAMDDLDFIEAIKCFSKAVNIEKSNSKFLFNLANAYYLNGWYDEAVTNYKQAVYFEPGNLDYRYALAYAFFQHKDYVKAKKEIDYILENDGNYFQAKVIKALIFLNEKKYIEAEKELISNLSAGCDDDFTLLALAKVETEIAKFEKAEKYIRTVLDRNPKNLSCQCELGEIYVKEKKYKDAIQLAKEITEENNKYLDGFILGAKSAYLCNNYELAKEFAQKALILDINCSEGYFYLAKVRMEEKDYEEAIECMKRAITFDVNNAKYYAQMAEFYNKIGDNETAFEYVKDAESIDESEEYKLLYKKFAAINRK